VEEEPTEKAGQYMSENQDIHEQDSGMTVRLGPLEIDWPRTIGYYGGVGLAVAFELVEPPLALFIAAIPLLKMLNRPDFSLPSRFVGQLLEGAARPVGGSAESTIQLTGAVKRPRLRARPRRPSILTEARQIANGLRGSTR
jgi:hypothetical protein